jgi:hypothetical protein
MVSTTATTMTENANAPTQLRFTSADFIFFVLFLLWSASVLLR